MIGRVVPIAFLNFGATMDCDGRPGRMAATPVQCADRDTGAVSSAHKANDYLIKWTVHEFRLLLLEGVKDVSKRAGSDST